MAKELKCKEGKTSFFMNNIPCELMEYYRELSIINRRAISQEIIIAMEKQTKKHMPMAIGTNDNGEIVYVRQSNQP